MRGHPRGVADRPHAIPQAGPRPASRPPHLGLMLAALVVASPFLAIGFLWASYYLVRAAAVLVVIAQAVLS